MLLHKNGQAYTEYIMITSDGKEKLITFSSQKTDSCNRFLFHKTTNRKIYDAAHKACKQRGLYDIIFQNEKGQITEGAISNIFVKKHGIYYTPPIECGLLNGIYRRYLLSDKSFKAEEKVLYREDIDQADDIILTNAVRGLVKVKLINDSRTLGKQNYAYA